MVSLYSITSRLRVSKSSFDSLPVGKRLFKKLWNNSSGYLSCDDENGSCVNSSSPQQEASVIQGNRSWRNLGDVVRQKLFLTTKSSLTDTSSPVYQSDEVISVTSHSPEPVPENEIAQYLFLDPERETIYTSSPTWSESSSSSLKAESQGASREEPWLPTDLRNLLFARNIIKFLLRTIAQETHSDLLRFSQKCRIDRQSSGLEPCLSGTSLRFYFTNLMRRRKKSIASFVSRIQTLTSKTYLKSKSISKRLSTQQFVYEGAKTHLEKYFNNGAPLTVEAIVHCNLPPSPFVMGEFPYTERSSGTESTPMIETTTEGLPENDDHNSWATCQNSSDIYTSLIFEDSQGDITGLDQNSDGPLQRSLDGFRSEVPFVACFPLTLSDDEFSDMSSSFVPYFGPVNISFDNFLTLSGGLESESCEVIESSAQSFDHYNEDGPCSDVEPNDMDGHVLSVSIENSSPLMAYLEFASMEYANHEVGEIAGLLDTDRLVSSSKSASIASSSLQNSSGTQSDLNFAEDLNIDVSKSYTLLEVVSSNIDGSTAEKTSKTEPFELVTSTSSPGHECDVEYLSERNQTVDSINFHVSNLEDIRNDLESPPCPIQGTMAHQSTLANDATGSLKQENATQKPVAYERAEANPNILYHTYNPCTRTRRNWADYDSDSDGSIYKDFFALCSKQCLTRTAQVFEGPTHDSSKNNVSDKYSSARLRNGSNLRFETSESCMTSFPIIESDSLTDKVSDQDGFETKSSTMEAYGERLVISRPAIHENQISKKLVPGVKFSKNATKEPTRKRNLQRPIKNPNSHSKSTLLQGKSGNKSSRSKDDCDFRESVKSNNPLESMILEALHRKEVCEEHFHESVPLRAKIESFLLKIKESKHLFATDCSPKSVIGDRTRHHKSELELLSGHEDFRDLKTKGPIMAGNASSSFEGIRDFEKVDTAAGYFCGFLDSCYRIIPNADAHLESVVQAILGIRNSQESLVAIGSEAATDLSELVERLQNNCIGEDVYFSRKTKALECSLVNMSKTFIRSRDNLTKLGTEFDRGISKILIQLSNLSLLRMDVMNRVDVLSTQSETQRRNNVQTHGYIFCIILSGNPTWHFETNLTNLKSLLSENIRVLRNIHTDIETMVSRIRTGFSGLKGSIKKHFSFQRSPRSKQNLSQKTLGTSQSFNSRGNQLFEDSKVPLQSRGSRRKRKCDIHKKVKRHKAVNHPLV